MSDFPALVIGNVVAITGIRVNVQQEGENRTTYSLDGLCLFSIETVDHDQTNLAMRKAWPMNGQLTQVAPQQEIDNTEDDLWSSMPLA